jgi:hypothetical protein
MTRLLSGKPRQVLQHFKRAGDLLMGGKIVQDFQNGGGKEPIAVRLLNIMAGDTRLVLVRRNPKTQSGRDGDHIKLRPVQLL